jgi:NADPH:quinone reductase-like Zn-dependent oxidoreductase
MLAIRVNEFGGPDVLRVEEVDIPRPGQDEILVRVLAAGVGPWDVSLRQGGYQGPLPYIPGGEFAGVVEGDTGSFASFYEGAPVYGYPGLTGCYAQYVTCPVERLAPIPAVLSVVDAAATPIDGLTAEQGLTDELGVGADDRVLITAAAGGLGHFAVQIARALEPRGSRLIRMAPRFDDGTLSVHVSSRYFWRNAARAQREVSEGHTRGKIVLIVDEDLAAQLEV